MHSNTATQSLLPLLNLGGRELEPSRNDKTDAAQKSDFKRVMAAEKQAEPKDSPVKNDHRQASQTSSEDEAREHRDDVSSSDSEQHQPDDSQSPRWTPNKRESEQAADDRTSNDYATEHEDAPSADFNPNTLVGSEHSLLEAGDQAEAVLEVPADAIVSLEELARAVSGVVEGLDSGTATVNDGVPTQVIDPLVQAASVSADAQSTGVAGPVGLLASANVVNTTARTSVRVGDGVTGAFVDPALAVVDGGAQANDEVGLLKSRAVLLDTPLAGEAASRVLASPTAAVMASNTAALQAATDTSQQASIGKEALSKIDAAMTREAPANAARALARPTQVAQGVAQFSLPDQSKPGQPQWQTAIADRVAVMASQRITSAEIKLDPPELGQLQVRVTLNQEQASVSFVSQHAVVREALDQTAFRLREMFDAEGLNLVDVDVSDQSFQQQDQQAQSQDGGADQDEAALEPVVTKISQGLVDQFV